MAKQTINIGSSPNKGDGDPIREAFKKINQNFDELYTSGFRDPTSLNSSLIPQTTAIYDLGSSAKKWGDLHVSDFIYLNGQRIEAAPNGALLINGKNISDIKGSIFADDSTLLVDAVNGIIPWSVISGAPVIPSDVSDLTDTTGLLISGGNVDTGDVTFDGVKVIGAGTASGDGNGYATLELVPDNNLYANNQYIVVDPTAPSHIHLRAGGTQDASNAELYLGGERTNARVNDYSGVKLNNNILNSNTTRQFDITTDFTNATWSVIEPGVYFLQFRTTNLELQGVHDQFGSWPDNTIVISDGTTTYTLTYNGYSDYLGNPNDRVIQVREAPPGGTTVNVQSMTFTINTLQLNYLSLEYGAFETYVNDSAYIGANGSIDLVTGTGNLRIRVNDNGNAPSWYFNTKGHIEFPQNVAPTTSKGSDGDEIGSVAFDGSYIYYCTQSYSDGVADIWKRVAWSADTW